MRRHSETYHPTFAFTAFLISAYVERPVFLVHLKLYQRLRRLVPSVVSVGHVTLQLGESPVYRVSVIQEGADRGQGQS